MGSIIPIIMQMRALGWGRMRILRALRERGYNVSEKAVRRALEAIERGEVPPVQAKVPDPGTPQAPIRIPGHNGLARDWSRYPHIPAPAVILSDLHIPYHDPAWIETVLMKAMSLGVHRVVLAGGILDARHMAAWPASPDGPTFEHEFHLAHEVVQAITSAFEVHIIPGNHDDRVSKRLDRHLRVSTVYRLLWPGVHVYDHHHLYVGRTWLVAHPGNYSRTPGQPAYDLAAKYGRNVAIAHTHKWTLTRDRSGACWVAEIGMCADQKYFEYIHRELRTFPAPQQGALIIDAWGRPIMLHPEAH